MIQHMEGNILKADAEALVNTVNCVGVMGKGIALLFKEQYPENFERYAQACDAGDLRPGRMLVVPTGRLLNPRYIINFPTKRHWKGKSRMEDIQSGLKALIEDVRRLELQSIAVPALGCGNGGLEWSEVAPIIESAFSALPDVQVLLYAPMKAPPQDASPKPKRKRRTARATARPRRT